MQRQKSKSQNLAALFLMPLLLILAGAPAQAGLIQIDFSATISNDGGATTDDITGNFILDAGAFFGIDVGGVDGLVTAGSAILFGTTQTLGPASAFTFASAGSRPGFGVLTLIGDYGSGFFSLDLASTDFFTTANAFDNLTTALTLGDLLAFTPQEALGTTRFANFVGYSEEWEGALTALTIAAVPEPAVLWLMLLAAPALAYRLRRA